MGPGQRSSWASRGRVCRWTHSGLRVDGHGGSVHRHAGASVFEGHAVVSKHVPAQEQPFTPGRLLLQLQLRLRLRLLINLLQHELQPLGEHAWLKGLSAPFKN